MERHCGWVDAPRVNGALDNDVNYHHVAERETTTRRRVRKRARLRARAGGRRGVKMRRVSPWHAIRVYLFTALAALRSLLFLSSFLGCACVHGA